MRRRELNSPIQTVPVLSTAVLLALCSCGQAFQSNHPTTGHSALAEGTAGSPERVGARPRAALSAANAPAAELLASEAEPEDGGLLEPIAPRQMLDLAYLRYEAARRHWERQQLDEARREVDLAFRLLTLVPSNLDEEQARLYSELQLVLSRLIVTMSVAEARPIQGMTEIPLVMNDFVEREIRSFQTRERQFFVSSFRRSGRYMSHILKKLEEQHMPSELAWLPLIESGFTPRALSPARALGLWQFIPSTGHRFGLQRDVWIDERMDPELATSAALMYLKQLHNLFGDWATAVAAYNCGEGAVMRAIGRQRIGYLDSFWDLFPILPYETARYVPRFLATLHIVKDPLRYGFDELGPIHPELQYELVEISRQVELRTLSRLLGIDESLLRDLNPSLRQGMTPPRKHLLRVPTGQAEELTAKLSTLPAGRAPAPNLLADGAVQTRYRVRPGDTLSAIAKQFRVSVTSLIQANSLQSKHTLSIGQILSIPRRGA
jgi:membrane-bound lytic murein transglycosylase D